MNLELVRVITQPDSTVGLLYELHPERRFLALTLEDEKREVKVPGETRIPTGRYRLALRRAGGMNIHYAARFRELHRGMLWLQDVPGFEWVYIHVGNTTDHTRGCILVGDSAAPRANALQSSEACYRRIYPAIAAAIEKGEEVWLTVADFA